MKLKKILVFLVLSSLLIGCGPSPLLNHLDEDEAAEQYKKGNLEVSRTISIPYSGVSVEYYWSVKRVTPPDEKSNFSKIVLFFTYDENNELIKENVELQDFYPYMPNMDHSDGIRFRNFEKIEDGIYVVEPINFFMPGNEVGWNIDFTILIDGKSYEITLNEIFPEQ
ncbi:MAG: hypothetical protein H6622_16610 [Halobacteriovoraceae bacterium]|nr:hypothetical protein [Halobacteriovoraceae bacterium]